MGFALGSFCLLLCGYRCFIRVLGEAWWAEAVLDGDRNSRFPLPPLYPSTTGCSPSSETSVCLVLHHLLPFPFKPSFPPAFSHFLPTWYLPGLWIILCELQPQVCPHSTPQQRWLGLEEKELEGGGWGEKKWNVPVGDGSTCAQRIHPPSEQGAGALHSLSCVHFSRWKMSSPSTC